MAAGARWVTCSATADGGASRSKLRSRQTPAPGGYIAVHTLPRDGRRLLCNMGPGRIASARIAEPRMPVKQHTHGTGFDFLLEAYRPLAGIPDEMLGPDGRPLAHW